MRYAAVVLLTCAVVLSAQTLPERPSLGEAARKARAEKEAAKSSGKRVFDNSTMSAAKDEPAPAAAVKVDAPPKVDKAELEKFYRARFAEIRDNRAKAQAQIAKLEEKLREISPNANRVIPYEYRPDVIKMIQDEIARGNKYLEKLKETEEAYREELRKKGLPYSWSEEK
jgi:predicted metal-dependent hydrolase